MMEELNTESIKEMLKSIPESLSPVERLILANEGTVQTLLSVLFKVPVEVIVLDQIENQTEYAFHPPFIIRWSKLVADYSPECKITVCLAQSVISSDNPGFITGIREKNMGIGQLISAKGLITRRLIKRFYSDENVFSRIYQIGDAGMTPSEMHINCLITEVFLKEPFVKASVMI